MTSGIVTGESLQAEWLELLRARFVGHAVRVVDNASGAGVVMTTGFTFTVADIEPPSSGAVFTMRSASGDPHRVWPETIINMVS